LTRVLFDPTQRDFLTQREKMEKVGIFRGNFPNHDPNQRWLTQPEQQKIDQTRVKIHNFLLTIAKVAK